MRRRPTWSGVRDGILFFSGLAGVAFETIVRRPPDYGLLPVFTGMIGLPAFLRKDEVFRDDDPDDRSHRARHRRRASPPNDDSLEER